MHPMSSTHLNRRAFLRSVAVSGASLAVASGLAHAQPAVDAAKLPRRKFGKSTEELSIIGFSGLLLAGMPQERADRAVAKAVEMSVNYFDVAPAYGNAQERMGPALAAYRKNCFLACKTKRRDADGAKAEMKRSMELLKTDYFDLYQLHALVDVKKDVDAAFAPGGSMGFLQEAKKSGQIRHIGITAHTTDAALAAMSRFDFELIMFPLNFGSFQVGDFGPKILEMATGKGMAVIAIKAMCRQEWPSQEYKKDHKYKNMWYEPASDPQEAELGLKFSLSKPITAAMPPAREELFFLAVEIGMKFKPITPEERTQVEALAAKVKPLFRAGKIVG